jgi:hypothetical protein
MTRRVLFRRVPDEVKLRLAPLADKVVAKKDGTFEARRTYYYRHGCTAEKFAEDVVKVLSAAGFDVEVLAAEDHWNAWPRDSFWLVRFRVQVRE